ncbi:MAG: hypothetical protein LUC22_03805 [Prevotella sp.]|nr:hypothetical protein [Prevotella sp.]
MKAFSPAEQWRFAKDGDRAYNRYYPSMRRMREYYGTEAAVVWLLPQVANFVEYCGVDRQREDARMTEFAYMVTGLYDYLTVGELLLFFARMKAGVYGKVYARFDPLLVGDYLKKFDAERKETLRRRNAEIQRRAEEERAEAARRRRKEMAARGISSWDEYVASPYWPPRGFLKKFGADGKTEPDLRTIFRPKRV